VSTPLVKGEKRGIDHPPFFLFQGIINFQKPHSGEMVIGNFHENNPSRYYMEFGCWYLNHRNESSMKKIAIQNGIPENNITISSEDEGVNLFMHIKR
jgi:extracellular factor (EF) 3-hydroxypalmitic acid methyl ester biosynthesis protein